MNEDTKTQSYRVTFDIVMPGMTKASTYTIDVNESSHLEAHAKAEFVWLEAMKHYDIKVKEVSKVIVA